MVSNVKILQKLAIIHKGKVLALRRSLKDESRPGTWDFVGGNVDQEDILDNRRDLLKDALGREVKEELGMKIDTKKIRVVYIDSGYHSGGSLVMWIGYEYKVDKTPKYKLSFEHIEDRWLTKKEFLKLDFGYAKVSMVGQINAILK